jgi:hypothetical protein
MNLFWARAENVTPRFCREFSHRFKTLRLCMRDVARLGGTQLACGASRAESFSLRDAGHDVSLRTFAAPTALETSAD